MKKQLKNKTVKHLFDLNNKPIFNMFISFNKLSDKFGDGKVFKDGDVGLSNSYNIVDKPEEYRFKVEIDFDEDEKQFVIYSDSEMDDELKRIFTAKSEFPTVFKNL